MRLLLDSHVVIWWLLTPQRLSAPTINFLQDAENNLFLSSATVWELGIKIAKGHLHLPDDYPDKLLADGFTELSVQITHAQKAATLPLHHCDPFDRLLIAQTLIEDLKLVTSDATIFRYDVPTIQA